MSSYNMLKKADRHRELQERKDELLAVQEGRWPRNLDDTYRWSPQRSYTGSEWAARVCTSQIAYLEDLEKRIAAGDPDLDGYEK